MNIALNGRWEDLVEDLVRQGRFDSADQAVEESLRLLEERESRLRLLRDHLEASIAEGGRLTDEDVAADLDGLAEELASQGD